MFSNARVQIDCRKLEMNQEQLIAQAAEWFIDKWGYTLHEDGKEHILKMLKKDTHQFYMVFLLGNIHRTATKGKKYPPVPIGMFSLSPYWEENEIADQLPQFKTFYLLDDVYVAEEFRSLGVASQIVNEAKKIAKKANQTDIILQTFTPALNGFYKRKGAEVLRNVETNCEGYPTDTLTISLSK